MILLDALLRFGAIGILLFTTVLVLRDRHQRRSAWLIAAFTLTTAAYALCSFETAPSFWSMPHHHPAGVLLLSVCVAQPVTFWLLSLELFSDAWRIRWWHWLTGALVIATGVASFATDAKPILRFVHEGVSALLFVHALVIAVIDWRVDLVETRRRLRAAFVITAACVGTVVTLYELVLPATPPAPLVSTAMGALLFGLSLGWSLVLVRLTVSDVLDPIRVETPTEVSADTASSPTTDRLTSAVLQRMEKDKVYREHGLTLASLASRMQVPEHQLRRAINKGLGFRNFNAYLNHYRLNDVDAALLDPEKRHLPILTLALDAGFGSIAPFNRAFRERHGKTPSEFRSTPAHAADRIVAKPIDS